MPARIVRFGGFEMDMTSRELLRAGRRVHLTPQAFQLLELLVARPGDLVTRDEIRTAIWGSDVFVDFEAAVNAGISQIRFALGDKATAPRFVETLPRRGYRFVAPVQEIGCEAPIEAAARSQPADDGAPSHDDPAPSDHVAEVSAPARQPPAVPERTLGTPSRSAILAVTSVAAIALALAIVAGEIGFSGPGTAAPRYSVESLTRFERGRSGLADAGPSELIDRVQQFSGAVALEPGFAEAYAGMAEAHLLIALYRAQDSQIAYAAAKAAAAKAVHLSPRLGDAHAAYAAAVWLFDWDWQAAGEHFRRAVSLAPHSTTVNHWYARYLTALGRHREAVAFADRVLRSMPSSPSAETYAGVAAFYAGDLIGAKEHCARAAALMPEFEPAQLCVRAVAAPAAFAPAVPEAYLQSTITAVHAGDRAQALDRLQIAANRHIDSLLFVGVQPGLRDLAAEPRFRQVADRAGLRMQARR